MLKIGEFARLAQVAVSTLRFCAEAGLRPPAEGDPFTGYRNCTSDQLPRLHRLLALRDLGFSLEAIRALLDEGVTPEQLRGMWRWRQAEQQARVREERGRPERVAARLTQFEEDGRRPCDEVVRKAVEPGDDPAALNLPIGAIPGGRHARRKLADWEQPTDEIGPAFEAMAAEHPDDRTRPSIEFYRSQRELILLLPVQAPAG